MALEIERPSHPSYDWRKRPLRYEVRFWDTLSDREPPAAPVWREDPWLVSNEGSVLDIIRWAEENARGRAFEVEAIVETEHGIGYVHLHGTDPTTTFHPSR